MKPEELEQIVRAIPRYLAVFRATRVPKWLIEPKVFVGDRFVYNTKGNIFIHAKTNSNIDMPLSALKFIDYYEGWIAEYLGKQAVMFGKQFK